MAPQFRTSSCVQAIPRGPVQHCSTAMADSRFHAPPDTTGYWAGYGSPAGGTYVLANIRGGGEYGPGWHTQAMRAGRHLVAEDFAAVAKDLVDRGITTVPQLGAQGGSNGGLLMGIMLTKYPQLFGALVCQVPLLDMRRFHLLLAGASWIASTATQTIRPTGSSWPNTRLTKTFLRISATRPY